MKTFFILLIINISTTSAVFAGTIENSIIKTMDSTMSELDKVLFLEKNENYVRNLKNKFPEDLKLKYFIVLHNYYYNEEKKDKALIVVEDIIEIFKKNQDFKNLAMYYIKKAEDLPKKSAMEADFLITESIKIAKDLKDDKLLLFSYINKAATLTDQGKFTESLKLLYESEKIIDTKIKDKELKIELYSEISYIHKKLDNYEKAKEYNMKIINIEKGMKKNNKEYYISLKNQSLYIEHSKYNKKEIIIIVNLLNDLKKINNLLSPFIDMELTRLNILLKKYEKSLLLINNSINYFKEKKDKENLSSSVVLKVDVLLNLGLYVESKQLLEEYAELLSKTNKKETLFYSKYLIYNELEDLDNALLMTLKYEDYYNNKLNKNFSQTLNDLKNMFKVLDKNKKNRDLISEKILKEKEIQEEKNKSIFQKKIIIYSYIAISLIVTFIILTILSYRKIKKIKTIDDVTKIYNEKTIKDIIKRKYNNSNNKYLSVFSISISIKNVEVKNETLVKISNIIKKNLRKEDCLGKFNKNDFIVVSKNNKKTIEKIYSRIEGNIKKEYKNIVIELKVEQKNNKNIKFETFINVFK
jgi:GGDEF domain-containing protein